MEDGKIKRGDSVVAGYIDDGGQIQLGAVVHQDLVDE